MKQPKLFGYLICAGLIFALHAASRPTLPGQVTEHKNYIHLKALDYPIQEGLSTRLFFPFLPKKQYINQLK
ncbi:hypothetical protein ACR784_07620 [Sphingobacterium multivorum]|uniref:hypothetical protein n=1 Tax=Sphingobacterium multivorum TaxID=28454 RepID=UPI003DA3DBC9